MSAINDYHNTAMEFAERALMERVRGNLENSIDFFEQALDCELKAIAEMSEPTEPTYSVLHRSAGTLALDCNQIRKAEQIVASALAQDPPPEIMEELRDLWEQIHFRRHLELRGVTLEKNEIQMSLSGQAVGLGVISPNELFNRVNYSSRLIHRIVERRHNEPFKESGRPKKNLREPYELFVSTPRAASFSVTLRLGRPTEQLYLPLNTSEILNEFMDLMELVNSSKVSEIQERIPDPAYMRNFFGLAKKIAPDGERIRQVGFTATTRGAERFVEVTRPTSEFPSSTIEAAPPVKTEFVEVQGTLRYADAIRDSNNKIKVIDEEQETHTVNVPEGMMNDIVSPMWNSTVMIKGTRKDTGGGCYIELQDIEQVEAKND